MEQLILSGIFCHGEDQAEWLRYALALHGFYGTYRCVMDPKLGGFEPARPLPLTAKGDSLKAANALVDALTSVKPALFEVRSFVMGATKVFIKLSASRILDSHRQRALSATAARLQALVRGFLVRQ